MKVTFSTIGKASYYGAKLAVVGLSPYLEEGQGLKCMQVNLQIFIEILISQI